MPPVVYVHVGAFKTGTSFLQHRLWTVRAELAERGVLFPGRNGWGDQVRALSHIAERPDLQGRPVPPEPWVDMVQTIQSWSGPTAILSFEFLSVLRPRQAQRLVQELEPAEVHIVLTARDLVRVVPAMWQEVLQGGQTWTWPQYCETVTSPLGRTVPPGRGFWRGQDLPAVVRRWSSAVPVERIHVVTVPPVGSAPEELWRRFCQATGIPPEVGTTPEAPRVPNESLDPAATELMRRVNLAVEGRMGRALYDRVLKFFVAKKVLAARAGPERATLADDDVRWARERGAEMAAELDRLGVSVVGDLGDLVGAEQVAPSAEPTTEQVLDAAVDVIAALVQRLGDPRRVPAHVEGPIASTGQEVAAPIGSRPVSRLVRTTYERFRH